jgi:hypothetical protein
MGLHWLTENGFNPVFFGQSKSGYSIGCEEFKPLK